MDDFAGSNDWRLPGLDGYAALFTAYGNLTQVSAFTGVEADSYWTDTTYPQRPDLAWAFATDDGWQLPGSTAIATFAVAVRQGDPVASVPEPQTLALSLMALGATLAARRRRARGGVDASSALRV